jgi:hypothetical protein
MPRPPSCRSTGRRALGVTGPGGSGRIFQGGQDLDAGNSSVSTGWRWLPLSVQQSVPPPLSVTLSLSFSLRLDRNDEEEQERQRAAGRVRGR